MSNNKKKTWNGIVTVLCLLLVMAGVAAVLYMAWTMPVDEAQAYIERLKAFAVERVVPIGTAVLGAVAVILAFLSPAMAKVKAGAERFEQTSDSISAEQTESVKTREAVEVYKREQAESLAAFEKSVEDKIAEGLQRMQEQVDAACGKIQGVSGRIDEIAERQDASMQVQLIETQNRSDLVRSGHAGQIERIAGKYRREDGHE